MITLTDDEKRMVFQLEGCHRYDRWEKFAEFISMALKRRQKKKNWKKGYVIYSRGS